MTGQVHRNEHSSTLSDNMFSTLEFGVAGFTFVAFVRIIIRLYDHGLLRQRVNVRTTTTTMYYTYSSSAAVLWGPFRTAVLFWGHTSQFVSSLSPKRDCGSYTVNTW